MSARRYVLAAVIGLLGASPTLADPVRVVAAENVYGDLAKQIGGGDVEVTSILANPAEDPHEFEASAKTAREIAGAAVVIANGAGYDPWVETLLQDGQSASRRLIRVAFLVGRGRGDNPHLWYDPTYMKAAAGALETHLSDCDPARATDYAKGAERFYLSLKPLEARIDAMRARYAHTPVTASEPVFGYMAGLLGLDVRNQRFALDVMNDSEPSASDVARFEDDLKQRKVKAMFYNSQADEPAVNRLVDIAKASGVPIVAVSETEPPGLTYQAWMNAELDALEAALSRENPMTALGFHDATIRLAGRAIISNASFEIQDGEFIGMLGANGAGKTTLMRAALGLTPLTSGTIDVFNQSVRRGNSSIGYMPQNRSAIVSSRLSGYDVVASAALGARFGFARLDKATRREIDWALDQVGAGALARRSISELSGGERQRLLLSQALLGRPRLLLLDEPLISLDPAHQKSVVEIARRLCDDLKLAILFSAHELNPLVNAIDRVLYLGGGAAVIGAVEDVVTGPVLSKLYGAEIEVIRVRDRYFVMAGGVEVESEAHRHEDHGGHDHSHSHEHGGEHV